MTQANVNFGASSRRSAAIQCLRTAKSRRPMSAPASGSHLSRFGWPSFLISYILEEELGERNE